MRREREPARRSGGKVYIYGKHALTEALIHSPHVIRKVFLSHEVDDKELRALLSKRGIPINTIKNREAGRMVGQDTAHQGVIAIADPGGLLREFKDFASSLKDAPDTMVVLLDELTDPHNVGAIIRSAAAFGAAGVLLPAHNQAPITGAVVKSSAGMIFRVPIVLIGNVNYAISHLKEKGLCSYGLEMNGTKDVTEEKFESPSLIIIGNEAKGIRQKTLELCDVRLRIPMHPRCESLNASVSAGVALYEWSKRHPAALT